MTSSITAQDAILGQERLLGTDKPAASNHNGWLKEFERAQNFLKMKSVPFGQGNAEPIRGVTAASPALMANSLSAYQVVPKDRPSSRAESFSRVENRQVDTNFFQATNVAEKTTFNLMPQNALSVMIPASQERGVEHAANIALTPETKLPEPAKWPTMSVHIFEKEASVQVWIRDAKLPGVNEKLIQDLTAYLKQRGLNLSKLSVNGRVVFGVKCEG